MSVTRLLIANRGEVAIRIARAAADLGITSVAVYAEDDAAALHVARADEARPLSGSGPAAYLDIAQIVAVAREAGCDAVHPGYGFLAERSDFAQACADAGLTFVGPSPEVLAQLGDKSDARRLAEACGVPVLPGTPGPTSLADARAFLENIGDGAAILLKARAGGGGRGMRIVEDPDALESAYKRCESEARAAFGNGDLYAERFLPRARHVEVQVLGDGSGEVIHIHERGCSLQRRHQKLVEIAPSPTLLPATRQALFEAATTMATSVNYRGLGTFEFLVDADHPETYFFIEANARLQVEHTVTEEITGLDLVQLQLQVAGGASLADLGLTQDKVPAPRGFAIQCRVNMETMAEDGSPRPAGGTLAAFEVPAGPGIRVDTFGYQGYTTSPRYDALLAKVIAHSPTDTYGDAVRRAARALAEFRIEGVPTNIPFLRALLANEDVQANNVTTRFVEEHTAELLAAMTRLDGDPFFAASPAGATVAAPERRRAGAQVDRSDPLAVLAYGKGEGVAPVAAASPAAPQAAPGSDVPEGQVAVAAPMQGTILSLDVAIGDGVRAGQPLLVMEAMKMEHVVQASVSGIVRGFGVEVGDTIFEGHPLVLIEAAEVDTGDDTGEIEVDLDHIRDDLREVHERHAITLDAARPDAVARRRKTGQRTARENVDDLVDPGSFIEYGQLAVAARRRTTPLEELIRTTPTDGLITGIGKVNGDKFGPEKSRCAVLSYDYTVLAGTQGQMNHRKHDRMFEIAYEQRLPVVFFTEGGGGRGSDSDGTGVAGLRGTTTFLLWGKLSGLVPLVGINSGRCFAGNAAILGGCDVVIATENSSIGMGGPAMIEGGGLGVFTPEEVGPMNVQVPNGVVDIAVKDEAEAVAVAKQYLSYFQGPLKEWEADDQRRLRSIIPENRLRAYDVRQVIETMADTGSVLEIRRHFGLSMVTAFARFEGRPMGIVANNPNHLAGAIDSDAADKASRFMQLCDAFDIPILFLCDTPGIMVGPEVEKTALVRHAARMFVTGANVSVPFMTIVLRKSYGLGAMAMAGGTFAAPLFAVSWPTGEFGGMGLEGQVKLGRRKELAAIEDPEERRQTYERMVAELYERGKALSTSTFFEVDDVIDPMETRRWIIAGLDAAPAPLPREGKKHPFVSTW